MLTSEEYREYLRCWRVFLDRIDHPGFRRVMTEEATAIGTAVVSWPRVWPSVLDVFSRGKDKDPEGTVRFCEVVRRAESKNPTEDDR